MIKNFVKEILSITSLHKTKDFVMSLLCVDIFIKVLKNKHISPNSLTAVNILIGFSALGFLFENHLVFVLLILTNILIDGLDGYYARTEGMQTRLGNLLDHGGDFILGVLFLLKSYFYLGSSVAVLLIVMALAEIMFIYAFNHWNNLFPSRVFLYFFILGLFHEGMIFQLVFQPLSVVATTYLAAGKTEEQS